MKMNDNDWTTITNLPGGNIRRMFIKKRPFDDVKAKEALSTNQGRLGVQLQEAQNISVFESYQICVLQGVNSVRFYNLDDQGNLMSCEKTNARVEGDIPNRILRFNNDHYDKFGIFILTDDKQAKSVGPEYIEIEQCRLFTFPFDPHGVS